MFTRKFFTAVPLFVLIGFFANSVFSAKSVFVINAHSASRAQAYRIDGEQVILQAELGLPCGADMDGPIALAVWPEKELMFITYDFNTRITWVSTKTLAKLGEIDTDDVRFAGIVVDVGKRKIYVAKREFPDLHVYKWNDAQQTIEPDGMYELPSAWYIYGLALDESNGRLYVADNTTTVKCYDTNTWALVDSFDITVGGYDRKAVSIAIDPNGGYLYTGNWPEYGGDTYLVQTRLSDRSSIETNVGKIVIGIDVDKDTGLVYCTAGSVSISNGDFRIYDSNLTLLNNPPPVIGVGRPGVAGLAVGGFFGNDVVNPDVWNTGTGIHYTTIQSAID
ncbi:MAG: hypothetical protein PHP01_04265, partial [Phycisphaerae bacterium]|nr:hypothetical protein [Phycisphaerae bacterium]